MAFLRLVIVTHLFLFRCFFNSLDFRFDYIHSNVFPREFLTLEIFRPVLANSAADFKPMSCKHIDFWFSWKLPILYVQTCHDLSMHALHACFTCRISLFTHLQTIASMGSTRGTRLVAYLWNPAPCFYANSWIQWSDWSIQIFNEMYQAVIGYRPIERD